MIKMATFLDGKYKLPEQFYYNQNHVFCDTSKKLIGLDQIGYALLKNPKKIEILVKNFVRAGQIFAKIYHDNGETALKSPCSGRIKTKNLHALEYMETDTYTKGFIIELEEIEELDYGLITGDNVSSWGYEEVQFLRGESYSFKVVELGDSAVGKTAIKVRLTDNFFKQDLQTTFGIDFGTKELKVDYNNGAALFSGSKTYNVKMLVWDVAGQEHYEKQRGMYYKGAKGALLCYDVTNPVSFENLDKWIEELQFNVGKNIPVLVVGNKIDLRRNVPKKKALKYAKDNGYLYAETSAKTGNGIIAAFQALAKKLIAQEKKMAIETYT